MQDKRLLCPPLKRSFETITVLCHGALQLLMDSTELWDNPRAGQRGQQSMSALQGMSSPENVRIGVWIPSIHMQS